MVNAAVPVPTDTIFVAQIVVLAFVLAAAAICIYLGLRGSSRPPEWWEKPWDAEEREWPRRPSGGGGELLPKDEPTELIVHG